MAAGLQVSIWIGLWCFWFVVSRSHHPTLLIDGVATALLLAAFAAAVYLNWFFLVPRYWKTRRLWTYWASLLFVMNLFTLLDVVVIKSAYDFLWGPDPRRYGFWVNYALEFIGMTVHLAAAAVVVWVIRRRRRKETPYAS